MMLNISALSETVIFDSSKTYQGVHHYANIRNHSYKKIQSESASPGVKNIAGILSE